MVITLRDLDKLDCSFKKECDSCKVELFQYMWVIVCFPWLILIID